MSHKDAARNYAWIMHLQRGLYREIPEAEKLAAAKSLGKESWLPDPQQERMPLEPQR